MRGSRAYRVKVRNTRKVKQQALRERSEHRRPRPPEPKGPKVVKPPR